VLHRELFPDRLHPLLPDEVRQDRHLAVRVEPLVLDLPRHVERIGHHDLRPGGERGVVGDDRLRQVGQLDGDARALHDAESRQRRGQAVHLVLQLAVRHPAVDEPERRGVAAVRGGAVERLGERALDEREGDGDALIVEGVPDALFHCGLDPAER
jgi:hypothetical protein